VAIFRSFLKWFAIVVGILGAAAVVWSIYNGVQESAGRRAVDAIGGAKALEPLLIKDLSEGCQCLYKRYRRAGHQKAFAHARDTGACGFSANQMSLGGFGDFSASWAAVSDYEEKGKDCAVVSLNDDYIHLGDLADQARAHGLNKNCAPAFVAFSHFFVRHSAFAYSPTSGGCGYSWRWETPEEAAKDAMNSCAQRYEDWVTFEPMAK
jgi:hypothetical protein